MPLTVQSPSVRAAVLTISTSVAAGESEDASGPRLAQVAAEAGCEVVAQEVLPDHRPGIAARMRELVDDGVSFIFTTGGTGLTQDDVTPEATRDVIDREAPGFAETMRAEGRNHTPLGILSRGISGVAGRTLIINFPGSPRSIDQLWPVVAPTLKHANETLRRGE
jgi:molybdenum cofactor synthesis domain-containing protein